MTVLERAGALSRGDEAAAIRREAVTERLLELARASRAEASASSETIERMVADYRRQDSALRRRR